MEPRDFSRRELSEFYVGGDLNFNLNVSLSGDGWVVVSADAVIDSAMDV